MLLREGREESQTFCKLSHIAEGTILYSNVNSWEYARALCKLKFVRNRWILKGEIAHMKVEDKPSLDNKERRVKLCKKNKLTHDIEI